MDGVVMQAISLHRYVGWAKVFLPTAWQPQNVGKLGKLGKLLDLFSCVILIFLVFSV